jgi:hypothetical protein
MPPLPIPPSWLTIAAGVATFALGIAHILQTRAIAREFKLVLLAHRRILTMALAGLGLVQCFIGAVVLLTFFFAPQDLSAKIVAWACAAMLLVFAVWTGSTGARSEFFLLRISHFVNIVAAALLLLGQMPE